MKLIVESVEIATVYKALKIALKTKDFEPENGIIAHDVIAKRLCKQIEGMLAKAKA